MAGAAQSSKHVQMPWSMTSRVAQQTAAAASMTPSMYERAKCHCYGKPLLCNRSVSARPDMRHELVLNLSLLGENALIKSQLPSYAGLLYAGAARSDRTRRRRARARPGSARRRCC